MKTTTTTGAPALPELPPPPVQEADENRLAEALGRFSETVVREMMTPRPDLVAIAAAAPVAELRQLIRETKYSRIPVYGENLDDIQGLIEVRDLLDHEGGGETPVGELARPAQLVPGDQAHRRAAPGDAGASATPPRW